jgi:hypothetical protein
VLPIDSPANDRAEVFLHPTIALLARAFGEAGLLSYTVASVKNKYDIVRWSGFSIKTLKFHHLKYSCDSPLPPDESPSPNRIIFLAFDEYTFCSGIACAGFTLSNPKIDATTKEPVRKKSLRLLTRSSVSRDIMSTFVV